MLDTCVWGGAVDELRADGHDVVWCGSWESDPGDTEILRLATEQERILITLDKDFDELVYARGQRHTGIIRLVGFRAAQHAGACAAALRQFGDEIAAGGLATVEPGRIRIREALK